MSDIRKQIVAYLTAYFDGEGGERLAQFGPQGEEAHLKEVFKELSSLSVEERDEKITRRIKALRTSESGTGFSEVHPAWLVEALVTESPRVISIILRYLPSRHVRFILDNLPKRIKMELPKLIETFNVPTPILDVIKERFERKFAAVGVRGDIRSFSEIHYLRRDELGTLFRDLGLNELAYALGSLDKENLQVLLNRLDVTDARSLSERMSNIGKPPASLLKDARYTILEAELANIDPKRLLPEVGVVSFAKAFEKEDIGMLPNLMQKLEPNTAYVLKRYVDRYINTSSTAPERKQLVMARALALAKAYEKSN